MSCFDTSHGKTTSYKFCFIKSILDNIFNCENLILTFDTLNSTFLKIYWNLICKYNLPQYQSHDINQKSSIELAIIDTKNKFGCDEFSEYDFLSDNIRKYYYDKAKDIFPKYVIGALYSDLSGKIYGFDKKEKQIYFNKNSFKFLLDNKCILEKINYYCWILWTENVLDKQKREISNLSLKLDSSTKKNRSSLNQFKKDLFIGYENFCFYCGCKINWNNCHIDHFISWQFVKDDNVWNLVLSCSKCNLKKK